MQKQPVTLDPQHWVSNYSDELYGYAFRKTGDSGLAEDLVQETFLAGLDAANKFKGECSERTWLYAILKFKIAGYYRKASTRYETRLKQHNDEDTGNDHYFNDDGGWKLAARPGDWGEEPLKTTENKELSKTLEHCIEKLPVNHKQVVVLKMLEEIAVEKICKELEITVTNYWVIIHRAKLQLRACLELNWFRA